MIQKKTLSFIFVLAMFSGLNRIVVANELISPRLTVSYFKLPDGKKKITVSLSARENDKRVNIGNAKLQIATFNESGTTLLGSVVTDEQGKATFNIDPKTTLPKDHIGNYNFNIQFDGSVKLDTVSKKIHVMDAFLEISCNQKDTIKNIDVHVIKLNDKGEKAGIPDVQVDFYVKRLFCLFQLGSEKTDSSGFCSVEFPSNMPGDVNGKVNLIAKIQDNDTYGNVEENRDSNWGKPVIIEPKPKRGLGDTDAPLWMVYTLLVLLSGVWLHVVYVIGLVIRINLVGKKALKQG